MGKRVFVLYRQFEDKYQCLEDDGYEILGIFGSQKKAEKYQKELTELDKNRHYVYGIQDFDYNKLDRFAYDF